MPKILAMVLAGGRVDELGVLTFYRPKSTMPFGGLYRIIDFPLSNLMHSGIERVGILSQYRSSSLIEHIGTGASWDMVGRHRGISLLPPFKGIHASDWYKGTADAVYQNLDFIQAHKPDMVLILSGDHVYRMDYRELVDFHLDTGADLSIAFVRVPAAGSSRFGLARIGDEHPRGGRLKDYVEKPARPHSDWASMTVYIFDTDVLVDVLNANAGEDSHEFGRDIIPAMLGTHRVYGFKHRGFWGYSRTLEEYWSTNMALLGDHPGIDLEAWQIRTNLDHEAIRDRAPATVGHSALLQDLRIYNGVRVEGTVKRSILFPGVHVEKDAVVEDSILFFDSQIGPGARLERVIADIGVSVGRGAKVGDSSGDLTTIGTQAQIPKDMEIGHGCSIYPFVDGDDFVDSICRPGSTVTSRKRPLPEAR